MKRHIYIKYRLVQENYKNKMVYEALIIMNGIREVKQQHFSFLVSKQNVRRTYHGFLFHWCTITIN